MPNGTSPTDNDLIKWAAAFLRPHLKKCIDEIVHIDKNKEVYLDMLKQPLILDRGVIDGKYIAQDLTNLFTNMIEHKHFQ